MKFLWKQKYSFCILVFFSIFYLALNLTNKATLGTKIKNRLRNKAGLTLQQKIQLTLRSIGKQRYTLTGKPCAHTTNYNGETTVGCTTQKRNGMQQEGVEWCQIRENLRKEGEIDWEMCRPDLDYNKLKSIDQEHKREQSNKMVQLMESLDKTINTCQAYENQCVNTRISFLTTDQTVNNILKSCEDAARKLDIIINDQRQTTNLEKFGAQLGSVIEGKEAAQISGYSSFLELKLDPLAGSPKTGPFASGSSTSVDGAAFMQSSGTYSSENTFNGSLQSDSDDVVSKDMEAAHCVIAPWLQQRVLAITKNGSGMDGYEEDNKGDGLTGKYYDNSEFYGSFYTQKDLVIDMDFTGSSPAPNVNNEKFSIRWSGNVLAPHTGTYNFAIDSDGSYGLTINNEVILTHDLIVGEGDKNQRTLNFLTSLIHQNESKSTAPKEIKSTPVNLIGGNKYKIVLAYKHNSANMVREEDPVYIKLYWMSNVFSKKIVESKYLFTENVFNPMKITGISPEIGIPCKLLENDLAFKDSDRYIMTDIPLIFQGLNRIKFNIKYYQPKIEFEINNPSTVYIAYSESYDDDPTPADFQETQYLININEVTPPPKHEWKTITTLNAVKTTAFKVKKKSFDAGKVVITINNTGLNARSITILLFYSFDRFNSTPVTCGGEEIWISQPTSNYYASCTASSQDVDRNQKCENGLNGEMIDSTSNTGGSVWATMYQGVGAWMQVNFKDTYQISKVEFMDRTSQSNRNKVIEVLFSNGEFKMLTIQNSGERREYKIEPPQKSSWVKFTIREVYSQGNNGGAFKVYGFRCNKAGSDVDTPENVGDAFITGIQGLEFSPIFNTATQRPINLDCNDNLDSMKFSPHQISVRSKILINCTDSCVTTDDDYKIFGSDGLYSSDSIICKAALQDKKIDMVKGGKLMMELKEESFRLKGKIVSGIKSWNKEYSKYTITFHKYNEPQEIIMKEGTLVDVKDPQNEGFIKFRITKINQESNGTQLELAMEDGGKTINISYPNQNLFPCGEKIPGRDCTESRLSLNLNRPIKIRFVTHDYYNSNKLNGSLPDFGEVFGTRGSYGWSMDMSSRIKRRVDTADDRIMTTAEFFPSEKSLFCRTPSNLCVNATWSVKTGPGIFNVKVAIGDTRATRVDLKVNDKFIVKNTVIESRDFKMFETTVMSVNNFISIRSECQENCEIQMSKINLVEITPILDENSWNKNIAQLQKKPERYEPCGQVTTGGRCSENPQDCVFDTLEDPGVALCDGGLSLVEIPTDYKCPDQRGKFKCLLRIHGDKSKCDQVCPKICKAINGNKYECS